MKDILRSTLQGIGIGSSIMFIFIVIFNVSIGFQDVISTYIFGAICGFLPFVYKLDNMPMPLKVIIHLGGSITTFFIVSTLNNWVPMQPGPIIGALTIFAIIFIVVWFIFLIINIQQSKKINSKLNSQ